ncbi:MAG: caspase family protein [Thermodesulfobacteriota bacterium]
MKRELVKTACFGLSLCTILLYAVNVCGEQRAALIIGISQYRDINIRDLKYADSDAKELKSTLTLIGGYDQNNIILLTNTDATSQNIRNAFRRLNEICKTNNIKDVLIFYSGHGVLAGKEKTSDFRKIGAGAREFLAPADADLADTYILSDGSQANDTFLKREWLASQVANLAAKSVTLLIDSCHSGIPDFEGLVRDNMRGQFNPSTVGVQENLKGIKVYARDSGRADTTNQVALISASAEKDYSMEFETLNHGAMSYALLKNIREIEKQTELGNVVQVTVGKLYESINATFYSTAVEGQLLVNYHKPQMFVMPNIDSINQIIFCSIKGTQPKPIPPKFPERAPEPPAAVVQKPAPEITPPPPSAAIQQPPPAPPTVAAPKPPPAPVVTAEKPPPEPAAPKGWIRLETIPAGADITLDGSPATQRTNALLELTAGRHLIVLQLPGSSYRHVMTVDIEPGKQTNQLIDLRGDLSVHAILKEAPQQPGPQIDVYLDGQYLGKSDLDKREIIAGTHELMVKYKEVTKTKSVEIRPASPLLVRYIIVQEKGPQKPTLQDSARDVVF